MVDLASSTSGVVAAASLRNDLLELVSLVLEGLVQLAGELRRAKEAGVRVVFVTLKQRKRHRRESDIDERIESPLYAYFKYTRPLRSLSHTLTSCWFKNSFSMMSWWRWILSMISRASNSPAPPPPP